MNTGLITNERLPYLHRLKASSGSASGWFLDYAYLIATGAGHWPHLDGRKGLLRMGTGLGPIMFLSTAAHKAHAASNVDESGVQRSTERHTLSGLADIKSASMTNFWRSAANLMQFPRT